MGIAREFREFAIKGSVVDMAVGIIIGAAFSKIVASFVDNILSPPLGLLTGNADFSKWTITLRAAAENAPAVQMKLGAFITAVIDFTLVAFALFLVVKAINRLRASATPEAKDAAPR